jgi:hypothetical protein
MAKQSYSAALTASVRHQNPPASGHVFDWLNPLDITHEKRVRSGCTCFFPIGIIENTCVLLFLDKDVQPLRLKNQKRREGLVACCL